MSKLDLIGIGIGPFNLSLAALFEKVKDQNVQFFEKKAQFEWHSEIIFADSYMQTNYLKDLVTPVDPMNECSFLNYLVTHKLFYSFLHTQRTTVTRKEFEQYCIWVAEKLKNKLKFKEEVESIDFTDNHFVVKTSDGQYSSKNICVATGLVPRVPDCAQKYVGPHVFHAKSAVLKNIDLKGKTVAIIGGGQTGIEVFRNALLGHWGKAKSLNLITSRKTLEPLDESAFTNEYFTPNYVNSFWGLEAEKKAKIVASQKLASDGNTPSYLLQLYNDLYRMKFIDTQEPEQTKFKILAYRKMFDLHKTGRGYELDLKNSYYDKVEKLKADVVILCTGFQSTIPKSLEPLYPKIQFDHEGRFTFQRSYAINWDGPSENKIYALNFSRHNHGIIDPQTSLMAWRSATVINDITGRAVYETEQIQPNFVDYNLLNDNDNDNE
ncbi:MAG: lysine N(6)-hydroxylase/L-ornithine N(5)-oxygenase family protein [Pseudobdellovibrio sp.]